MNADDWVEAHITMDKKCFISPHSYEKNSKRSLILKVVKRTCHGLFTLEIPSTLDVYSHPKQESGRVFEGWTVTEKDYRRLPRKPGHLYLLLGEK